MIKRFAALSLLLALTGCNAETSGVYAADENERAIETKAVSNAMCRIENQARCGHLIENRTVFSRFLIDFPEKPGH